MLTLAATDWDVQCTCSHTYVFRSLSRFGFHFFSLTLLYIYTNAHRTFKPPPSVLCRVLYYLFILLLLVVVVVLQIWIWRRWAYSSFSASNSHVTFFDFSVYKHRMFRPRWLERTPSINIIARMFLLCFFASLFLPRSVLSMHAHSISLSLSLLVGFVFSRLSVSRYWILWYLFLYRYKYSYKYGFEYMHCIHHTRTYIYGRHLSILARTHSVVAIRTRKGTKNKKRTKRTTKEEEKKNF